MELMTRVQEKHISGLQLGKSSFECRSSKSNPIVDHLVFVKNFFSKKNYFFGSGGVLFQENFPTCHYLNGGRIKSL